MAPPHDDRELLEALRRGDERAFARLVGENQAAFVRIVRAWLGDDAAAEEAVQDGWLVALESLERFEGRSALRTWLCGIMINVARNHARARRRTVPMSALVAEELGDGAAAEADLFLPEGHRWAGHFAAIPAAFPTPAEALERAELLEWMDSALAQLPPLQQQVMLLFDVQRFTGEEVCNMLGLADTHQRVLLHRARSKVRAILEQRLAESGEAR